MSQSWTALIFRKTELADVKDLFSVRGRTREHRLSTEQLAEAGITIEGVTADMANGKVTSFLCTHDSNAVGFCNGDTQTGEVLVLAVLAEYEGQGIGKRLLALVVDSLRQAGCGRIWLSANSSPAARSHGFYRRLGWRPTGETHEDGTEILTHSPRRDGEANIVISYG